MSLGAEMFARLVNYQHSESETIIAEKITEYIRNKYDADIYKCLFSYNEKEELCNIHIYLKNTVDFKRIAYSNNGKTRILVFSEDIVNIKNLLNQLSIPNCFDRIDGPYKIYYSSFEQEALEDCYRSAFTEFKEFKRKHINPETMEECTHSALFVVYKSKELMEQAEQNGEQAFLRDEYYKFIKKFDTYNYITPQKHLLVHFDYVGHARSSREYSDMYWDMLAAE